MSTEKKSEDIADKLPPISWVDFLQEHPPGSTVPVVGATKTRKTDNFGRQWAELIVPELQLHCPEQPCNAYMFFKSKNDGLTIRKDSWTRIFLSYWCRNCGKYLKTFAIAIILDEGDVCSAISSENFLTLAPQSLPEFFGSSNLIVNSFLVVEDAKIKVSELVLSLIIVEWSKINGLV